MEHPFYSPLDESLFKKRIVQISGGVNSEMAHKVNKQLLALEAADATKPIYLFINSPGGEVNSGFSIFDTAKFIEPKVVTLVTGLAASMGSLIALCAPKERRFAFPNSKLLIHQPLISGMIQGQASDLEIHAKDIINVKKKINQLYATECGKTLKEVEEATDRDHWLDPEEAVQFGLISKIIKSWKEIQV